MLWWKDCYLQTDCPIDWWSLDPYHVRPPPWGPLEGIVHLSESLRRLSTPSLLRCWRSGLSSPQVTQVMSEPPSPIYKEKVFHSVSQCGRNVPLHRVVQILEIHPIFFIMLTYTVFNNLLARVTKYNIKYLNIVSSIKTPSGDFLYIYALDKCMEHPK